MKYTPQVYINDEKIDLFDDESISLSLVVKDFNEITKVMGDFSQQFTIPASRNNNRILSHWYNADISTGNFNPAVVQSARIEINHLPFKSGVIRINSAKLKNGRAVQYTLTFFSNIANLKSLFGQDKLYELDLSAYALPYDQFLFATGSTYSSGDVIIPMIGVDTRIRAGTVFSIDQTRPAITVKSIMTAIGEKYGVSFTGDFFSTAPLDELFMWANRDAERASSNMTSNWTYCYLYSIISDPSSIYSTGFEYIEVPGGVSPSTNYFNFYVAVNTTGVPDPSSLPDIYADLMVYDLLADEVLDRKNNVKLPQAALMRVENNGVDDQHIRFYVRSASPCKFDFSVEAASGNWAAFQGFNDTGQDFDWLYSDFHFTDFSYNEDTLSTAETVRGGLPDMTISDFLSGLIKMFNLVVIPSGPSSFEILSYNDWLSDGDTIDVTKYVQVDDIEVSPIDIYGKISYKFKENESALYKQFKENNSGVGYGDSEVVITDAFGNPVTSEEFTIELPFTNMVWERLVLTSSNTAGSSMSTTCLNAELTKTSIGPYLFLRADRQFNDSVIYVEDYYATTASIINPTYIHTCYQWSDYVDNPDLILNFDAEQNPFTYTAGATDDPTLYNTYWKDYITDKYDIQARRYRVKAVLPLGLMLGLKMNDVFVISGRRYIANKVDMNITNGECTLELFNTID